VIDEARATPVLRETADARPGRMSKRVGLGERLHHRPGQLSGGGGSAWRRSRPHQSTATSARRRTTGALDHASATSLGQLLVELNREEGLTLIVVTHALEMAKRMGVCSH